MEKSIWTLTLPQVEIQRDSDVFQSWIIPCSFLFGSRRYPNSVFYAETTFAGGEATENTNWLSALVHRCVAQETICSMQDLFSA